MPVSSPERDKNLLFGMFAVQLRRVTSGQLAEAAGPWSSDPSQDLGRQLVESEILDEEDRSAIHRLVAQTVDDHSGDARSALNAFGGLESARKTFSGTIDSILASDKEATRHSPGLHSAITQDIAVELSVQESVGRYTRQSEHAVGGMGRVLIVHDTYLNRDVALKELLPDRGEASTAAGTSAMLGRFLREAQITGKLEHPSIVPVYEMGHREDGTLYYTMRFVRGQSLSAAIGGARTLEDRLKLMPHYVDLCHAIAYAHSRGIIHRDVKPDNVMVGEYGETVVIDWGIAKDNSSGDPDDDSWAEGESSSPGYARKNFVKTEYGQTMGTAAYMPPEQAKGQLDQVGERSDVYALGVVLYEILTGTAPFGGGTAVEIIHKVITEDPQRAKELQPDIPSELAAIIEHAMEKNPEDRYASAKALAEDVQRFQSGALVRAHRYRFADLVSKFAHRNRHVLATAGAALIALLIFGAYSFVEVYRAEQEAVAAKEETEAALTLAEENLYHANIQLASSHVREGAEGLARAALEAAPSALRNWEWGYLVTAAYPEWFMSPQDEQPPFDPALSAAENWRGSTGRLVLSPGGHDGEINSIAFDPQGKRMITAAADATARIWDFETGGALAVLRKPSDIMQSANFGPRGDRAVTASTYSSSADIWDAHSGEHLVSLAGHAQPINQARFGPGGERILTVSADQTAKIWDAFTGAELLTIAAGDGMLMDGRFSEDGTRVLTLSVNGVIRNWNAATGEAIGSVDIGNPGVAVSAQLSRTYHSAISAFADGTSSVWNGRRRAAVPLEAGRVGKLDYAGFSMDESAVVAPQKDRGALVWDTASGRVIAHVGRQQGRLLSAAFSPDGRAIVSAGINGSLHVWQPGSSEQNSVLKAHDDILYLADFSPDGSKLVAASYDGTASLWDVESRKLLGRFRGHESEVFSAFFSEDGQFIQSTSLTETRFWDPETLEETGLRLKGADGKVELGTGNPRDEFALVIQGLIPNPIAPGGRMTVTMGGGSVQVWSIDTGELVAEFSGLEFPSGSIAFSPDGTRIVSTGRAGDLAVWELESGLLVTMPRPHGSTVSTVTFSQDGRRVLSASIDQTARIWDAQTGEDIVSFEGHASIVVTARFSPDNAKVVTASGDGTAIIWDAATGARLAVLRGLVGSVINASFSPDGTRVLTMSLETATVWDLNGRELTTLNADNGSLLTYARWSPSGDAILTCYRDGSARLWTSVGWKELSAYGNPGDALEDRLRARDNARRGDNP